MKSLCLALSIILAFCSTTLLADDHHHMQPGEKLGNVSFPTSCAQNVQQPFERGLALLYSFEYEQAENQFNEVASQDAKCAIAYWGQAMSLYHQLWSRPTRADLQRGHELLQKAQQLKPKTARERDYIEALAVFYRKSDKLDHSKRASLYAAAMKKVYQRNPNDREAGVFYALALLGSARGDDPTLANQKEAVGILNTLFVQEPDHPGIAHYIIHACDNPQLAGLGLIAARKYAAIAPSSPHAVHMPSHIFARLGLWQDDINSNLAALKAADQMAAMHFHVMHHRMHSMDFLEYSYLQIGDDEHAKEQVDALAQIRKQDVEDEFKDYSDAMRAGFAARYALERRQWKEAMALEPPAEAPHYIEALTYWAHAVAAGHLRDVASAQAAIDKFNALMEATRKSAKPYHVNGMQNNHDEAQAWLDFAQGKNDDAIRLLRSVADKQDKIGKGETETPAREMLADMLLQMDRPKDALAEYEVSLKTDPNRFNGLYGAAQAADQLHEKEKASSYYAQLLKNCDGVSSDRPELAKAKTLVAAK